MRLSYLSLAQLQACIGSGRTGYIAFSRDSYLVCKQLFKFGLIAGYVVKKRYNSLHAFIEIIFNQKRSKRIISRALVKSHPSGKIMYKIGRIRWVYSQDRNWGVFRTNKGILSSKKVIQTNLGGECLLHVYSI